MPWVICFAFCVNFQHLDQASADASGYHWLAFWQPSIVAPSSAFMPTRRLATLDHNSLLWRWEKWLLRPTQNSWSSALTARRQPMDHHPVDPSWEDYVGWVTQEAGQSFNLLGWMAQTITNGHGCPWSKSLPHLLQNSSVQSRITYNINLVNQNMQLPNFIIYTCTCELHEAHGMHRHRPLMDMCLSQSPMKRVSSCILT